MIRKVDISHKTVFFITGFIALIWALYLVREVIILLFMAIILMSALSPLVERLEKIKIPKSLAIAMIYLIIIGLIAGLISIGITPLIEQTNKLAQALPKTIGNALPPNLIDSGTIERQVGSFTSNAVSVSIKIFSELIAFISVGVLTFYLLLERDKLDHLIAQFFIGREEKVKRIVRRVEDKLGAWLRGQLVLSLMIGVSAYVALLLIGVPYALPLAIIAGLMEVVPVIGPIISAIPSILIAYVTLGPVYALVTAGAFFVIQQLENHIIVPQIMKKAVGLNPLIVILAVAMGGRLLGFAGALLAVPIAVTFQVVLEEILQGEKEGLI
jgi:predicted PurR-regulated permease PerM